MNFFYFAVIAVAVSFSLNGCVNPRITNTSRSAVEQNLLTSAVERNICSMRFERFSGQTALVDYSFLASQADKEYIQAAFYIHLYRSGIKITADKEKADIVIRLACGIHATDDISYNLGTPTLPIPLPYTDISFAIPEISLIKKISRTGTSRLNVLVTDAKNNDYLDSLSSVNSRTVYNNWIVFFFFPFTSRDVEFAEPGETTTHFF